MVAGVHGRYLLALTIAHLIPRFSAGPIVAHLYRLAGFQIGREATFGGPVRILSGAEFESNLVIGDNVLISTDVTINVDALVRIEDSVSIGPCVRIYTANHPVGPSSGRMSRDHANRPVTIERGTWIRLGATILPGVTVGHGSVVAAGSVVTKSVPPNSYVEGNPATVTRTLPDEGSFRPERRSG